MDSEVHFMYEKGFDGDFEANSQLVDSSEMPPVAGHVAVEYKDFMIVWGGYYYAAESQYHRPNEFLYIFPYRLCGKTQVWIKYKVDKGDVPPQMTASCGLIQGSDLFLFGGNWMKRDDHGMRQCSISNNIYKLSLLSGIWTKIAVENNLVPTPRDKVCGFVTNNGLYFFGGYGPSLRNFGVSKTTFLGSSSEFYEDENQGTNSWNNQLLHFDGTGWHLVKHSGDIPSHRAAAAVTVIPKEGKAYLFGGRDSSSRLADFYSLDLKTFVWTKLQSFNPVEEPIGRSWSTLTYNPDGDYMLLYGGLDNDTCPMSDRYQLEIRNNLVVWKRLDSKAVLPRLWHTSMFVKNAFIFYAGMYQNPNESAPCTSDLEILQICPSPLLEQSLRCLIQHQIKTGQLNSESLRSFALSMPFNLRSISFLTAKILNFKHQTSLSCPADRQIEKVNLLAFLNRFCF
uniref:Kelch domain-containing protein 2 n=1 Tax=Panagrolaimus sp. JU765 TaxID=591449 RepID=A0AC34QMA4_9BILA